jgi:hypothetical protein
MAATIIDREPSIKTFSLRPPQLRIMRFAVSTTNPKESMGQDEGDV